MAAPSGYVVSFLMISSFFVSFAVASGRSPLRTFLAVIAAWAVALFALSLLSHVLGWLRRPRHRKHPGHESHHADLGPTEAFSATSFDTATGTVAAGARAVSSHHHASSHDVGPAHGSGDSGVSHSFDGGGSDGGGFDGGGFDGGGFDGGGFDGGGGGSID